MALSNSVQRRFDRCLSLITEKRTAEKARIRSLEAEATKIFNEAFSDYLDLQSLTNWSAAENHITAELITTAAESALLTSNLSIAREITSTFLQSNPQKDRYFCKAKLIFAQIISSESQHTNGIESLTEKKIALAHIMTALDVVILPENAVRYKFLVYNCSVALWAIVNPFLRPKRARYFLNEIQKMCSALEGVDDPDKDWRILYLSATAFCLEDDKQNKPASDLIDKAIEYAERELITVEEEEKKLSSESEVLKQESEGIMQAMRQQDEYEEKKSTKKKIDPDEDVNAVDTSEPVELPPLTGLAAEPYEVLKESLDSMQSKKAVAEEKARSCIERRTKRQESVYRLYMQRILVNPADAKNVQGRPIVDKSPRAKTLVQLQCIRSGVVPEKDIPALLEQMFTNLASQSMSPSVSETLLDISRNAWMSNLRDLAIKSCEKAETEKNLLPLHRCKIDVCKALKLVADISFDSANEVLHQRLTIKQTEGYAVERKIEAIKIFERILTILTTRCDDHVFLQEVCIHVWNVGYMLLQPHLRKNVHRAFQLASGALEQISSPLQQLRAQIYFELCKIEEQNDFVSKALEEGRKAMYSDYGELEPSLNDRATGDLNRFRVLDKNVYPFVSLLDLRSNVYSSPSSADDQVLLMLQQAKESSSKSFQIDMMKKSLVKIIYFFESADDEGKLVEDSLASPSKSQVVTIPETPLDVIESVVKKTRSSAPYESFSNRTQKYVYILSTIAQLAQKHQQDLAVQQASVEILRFVWDPTDKDLRAFIYTQSDTCYLLANSLIDRLSRLKLSVEQQEALERDEEALSAGITDPRSLGVMSKYATEEMMSIKELIVTVLMAGINLSLSVKDEYGYQNGAIYTWNFHIHVFRKKLYSYITPSFSEIVKLIFSTIENFKTPSGAYFIDEKLRACYVEAIALIYFNSGDISQAVDVINKASITGTPYIRRKLCELAGKFAASQSAAAGGGAAKGGKGGGASGEPMKFDDPFLNTLALLAQLESPEYPKDQWDATLAKAVAYMSEEVPKLLASKDMKAMTQEVFDQVSELRVECWARITRMKLQMNDIHGCQLAAEQCLQVVSENNMSGNDIKQLSPRVWRWVSVCERYFGITLSRIIQPDGQEKELQNELRLAALRHFTLACQFGERSEKEDLIVAAAGNAWNISFELVNDSNSRNSLLTLQRQIVGHLLTCKTNPASANIRLQFYLAMIDEYAQDYKWEQASEVVMEAFENVPGNLQKPLWQWRIVVMSKRGKNVLDAIQKLKEGDVSLQARVYAILARSSSNPKQQADAYFRAVDLLKIDTRRTSYILEACQWMASSGFPKKAIYSVLVGALDVVYELEDKLADEEEEPTDDDDTSSKADSRKSSAKSTVRSSTARSSRPPGSASGRTSTAGSRKNSSTSSIESDEPKLTVQLCDQAIRANAMAMFLESSAENKMNRCLELCYYVERSKQIWDEANRLTYKAGVYDKLTSSERDQLTFEEYVVEYPEELNFPADTVSSLLWVPDSIFFDMTAAVVKRSVSMAPCSGSIEALPLTAFYLIAVSDHLLENGFPQKSLLCLSWLRLIAQTMANIDCADLAVLLYYKISRALNSCGLSKIADKLPKNFIGVDITSYFRNIFSMKSVMSSTSIAEVTANERLQKYGFSTWTGTFDSLQSLHIAVDIIDCLYNVGNVDAATVLANHLYKEYSKMKDSRNVCRTVVYVAKGLIISGDYDTALTMLISCNDLLTQISDAHLLANHSILLIEVYCRLGRQNEGFEIALQSIEMIRVFTNISVSNPQSGNRISTSNGGTELSYESVSALCAVYFVFTKFQTEYFKGIIESGKPGTVLSDIASLFCSLDELFELVVSVHGGSSILSYRVQYIKGTTQFILTNAVRLASYPLIPESELEAYTHVNISSSVESLRKAMSILLSLKAFISDAEQRFLSPESEANQFQLLSSVVPALAAVKIELAKQCGHFAVLRQENIFSGAEVSSVSVIEKYLMETQPEEPLVPEDFSVSYLTEAIHSANSAAALWPLNSSPVVECECRGLTFAALKLAGSVPNTMEVSALLSVGSRIVVKAVANELFDAATCAGFALADLTLRSDPAAAFRWLSWNQSMTARNWMYSIWTAALNPASEVAASLNRLVALHDVPLANTTIEKRREVEELFLTHSSSSYRRLDVSMDPADIIPSLPVSSVLLSIQFDPYRKHFYVSLKKSGVLNEDSFIIEKLPFTDSMNHSLGNLKSRHIAWMAKVQRMVTMFSESLTSDHDIAGDGFQYSDSRLESQERSIESTLTTLISEFQALFYSVLCSGSRIGCYFQEIEENDSCVLLLDPILQDLPWEGLPYFGIFNGRVYRDYSIHFMRHRASRAVASLPCTAVKVCIDSFNEDPGPQGIRQSFDDLKKKQSGLTKSQHLCDPTTPLSILDWIKISEIKDKPSGLFLHILGRLGSVLSPRELASLNYEMIAAAVVVDQGHTFTSFRRQESADNLKLSSDILCENSVNINALLSLSGVGTVIAQHWTTSISSQKRFVDSFWCSALGQKTDALSSFSSALKVNNDSDGNTRSLKKWVNLARVFYGSPSIKFSSD